MSDDAKSIREFKAALRKEGGRHRSPDTKPDARARRDAKGLRRPGPKHEAHEYFDPLPSSLTGAPPKKRAPTKKAAKAASRTAPVTAPLFSPSPPARRRGASPGVTAAAGEATEYARRAAIRQTAGGKPSTVGRAGSGAAAGVATGAALGSIVPGLGTAVGAGAGALVGAGAGTLSGHKAKKSYKAAMRADSAGPRRILLAEFTVCAAIAALSPLTDAKRTEAPGDWMKRMTAIMGLFFILSLISAAGRGSAKMAAGLGGLVTIVLMISQRDLFTKLATIFGSGSPPGTNSRSTGVTEAPVHD